MTPTKEFAPTCPIPIAQYPHVLLAHGGGGKLMNQLIEKMFSTTFDNAFLRQRHDAVVFPVDAGQVAFTTDSFVVRPLFFPGGDIGELAVYGTVNDLAMSGARPLYLSAGFILEEGLPMETLWRIVQSMARACRKAGVQIVTGDTKVVDRGKGDGIFINTSGIGVMEGRNPIRPSEICAGDALIVNGDIGRHGIAIMAVREGLEFQTTIESDAAPLADLVLALLSQGIRIHCMRDLTRGGLASALNELAGTSRMTIGIDELSIPVREDVSAACEMLGLDPLHVANEGRFVAFVAPQDVDRVLEIMRSHPQGQGAACIGAVTKAPGPLVTMKSRIGANRIVDMLSGEQLPRIC